MNRILELLKEDFGNRKLSAEYQLALNKVCEAEDAYMKSLTEEQKKEYLKFSITKGSMTSVELDEFAIYIFENLKNFF